MEDKKTRKCVGLLLFLSWLAYTAANVGRMNYSASMVAVIEETGAAKDSAGLVASFFFFAYGAGQLVNGLLCKRYHTRIAVFLAHCGVGGSQPCVAVLPGRRGHEIRLAGKRHSSIVTVCRVLVFRRGVRSEKFIEIRAKKSGITHKRKGKGF